jgi:DNA-binding IclR family transcriptional regulator
VLRRLLEHVGPDATLLLCRLYRDQVMCVAQLRGPKALAHLAYERGRPMPLLRGAPSKAILAQLPARRAEQLWQSEARKGARDPEWPSFRSHLASIRKAGVVVSNSEVDSGVIGVAACVFEQPGRPVGALCAALPNETATPPMIARVSILVRASADEITATLAEREDRSQPPEPTGGSGKEQSGRRPEEEKISASVAART